MTPLQKVDSFGLHPSKSYEFDEYIAKNEFLEYAQEYFCQIDGTSKFKLYSKRDFMSLILFIRLVMVFIRNALLSLRQKAN